MIDDSNISIIINKLVENYKYPYVTSHEILFEDKISTKFIIGIVINKHNDRYIENRRKVVNLLNKYKMPNVKLFTSMPVLLG